MLTYGETSYNVGAWGVNLGTGQITVPAGVTHVRMTGQVRLNTIGTTSDPVTDAGRVSLFFRINGATPAISVAGNYHFVFGQAGPGQAITSYLTPVVEGDILTMLMLEVNTDSLATTTDGDQRSTWFGIEGYDYA